MTVFTGIEESESYNHIEFAPLTAYGKGGNDTLSGNVGDDYLYGGYGSDKLQGRYGNDYLDGGGYSQEIDTLTGMLGADTFVIGDSTGVGYLGGFDSATNTDSSYALIEDFFWQDGDKIQAYGSASNYSFGYQNFLGGSAEDTGIYYGNDLIGVVQDTTNVSFTLDFNFV